MNTGVLDAIKWKEWKKECGRVQPGDARFRHTDGEHLIRCCQLLSGDEAVLQQLGEQYLEGWYELTVAKVLFTQPQATMPQLYKSVTWAQNVYAYDPQEGSEHPLENICNAVMGQDHFSFFQYAENGFKADDDWWFCCHFADLMDAKNLLDTRHGQGGRSTASKPNFREYIVLEFASHLFAHPSQWSGGTFVLSSLFGRESPHFSRTHAHAHTHAAHPSSHSTLSHHAFPSMPSVHTKERHTFRVVRWKEGPRCTVLGSIVTVFIEA
jgi:hypothetical protein